MFKEKLILKKRMIIIGITLLIMLIELVTANVHEYMEKPVLFEGDYWEYDIELFNEELESIITVRVELKCMVNIM